MKTGGPSFTQNRKIQGPGVIENQYKTITHEKVACVISQWPARDKPKHMKKHQNRGLFRVFLLVPMKNQTRAAEERRKTKPAEGAQKLLLLFYAFFAAFGEKWRCSVVL